MPNLFEKIKYQDGRRKIKIFGIKILSYKKKSFSGGKISQGTNILDFGKNVKLKYKIAGNNNKIFIGDAKYSSKIKIFINGDNNTIQIKNPEKLVDVSVTVGSHVSINNCNLYIDENLNSGKTEFLFHQHKTKIDIGKNCLFSYNNLFRTGEVPHLIFDLNTGEYLDKAKGIKFGDEIWLGQNCFVMKNAIVPNGCIVGSASVITKEFSKPNCVIAGNPAKICKENIKWIQNTDKLDKNSIYYKKNFQE